MHCINRSNVGWVQEAVRKSLSSLDNT